MTLSVVSLSSSKRGLCPRNQGDPMPRFVRPSWVEVRINGEMVKATGPRRRDCPMELQLFVRERGSITKCLVVAADADGDTVRVKVIGPQKELLFGRIYVQ